MKRILVIGSPGSGKSFFAGKLARITDIPLCHLDMLFWNADRTTVSREVFLERLSEVMSEDSWIIDGNYSYSMEMRLEKCDTVFFFDLPVETCLKGITERRGKPRPDLPWNEADYEIDGEFIEFVKNFPERRTPEIYARLEKFPDKQLHIFRSRSDADSFLGSLKI